MERPGAPRQPAALGFWTVRRPPFRAQAAAAGAGQVAVSSGTIWLLTTGATSTLWRSQGTTFVRVAVPAMPAGVRSFTPQSLAAPRLRGDDLVRGSPVAGDPGDPPGGRPPGHRGPAHLCPHRSATGTRHDLVQGGHAPVTAPGARPSGLAGDPGAAVLGMAADPTGTTVRSVVTGAHGTTAVQRAILSALVRPCTTSGR
ncbi:hypothetical protein [Arsenicicoccus dermatophilus]|uniref:hypothetical protein n=1 Tax=Arsenicicoccus dermatophilus TaxID=1076331 RepID=UPI003916D82A